MNKTFLLFILLGLFSFGLTTRTGSPCQVTEDCPDLHTCKENPDEGFVGTVCVHKPLFPITAREVIGSLIILFLNSLLTAGGVGAAAAYVPYIMVLFNFTLSHSVAIGYCTVFGGGIGNLINIVMLKNPKTKRFLTNYNINMIVLPALMIGVMIGMILQRIFPPIVTNLILLLVLCYSFTKNFMKLKLNLKKERQERESAKKTQAAYELHQNAIVNTEEKGLNNEEAQAAPTPEKELSSEDDDEEKVEKAKVEPNNEKNNDSSVVTAAAVTKSTPAINVTVAKNSSEIALVGQPVLTRDPKAEKRELLYQREQKFPFHKVRELFVNIVIIIVVGLIRGTKKFSPIVGVDWTCGWDFGWFAAAIILFGLSLTRNIYLVLKWQKEKEEVGYEFLPEEPYLDQKKIIRLLFVSTAAGIIGAIVALGGSMIVGPTLLDFKMPPAFSAATTSVFMIFSMFNTMFQTILNKKIASQEIAWFLPLALVFSFTSSKIVNWYVKKTGKQSTIIILILGVTTLGFCCLLYVLISGLITDFKNETTFTPVC